MTALGARVYIQWMRRFAAMAITALLLWALVPGLEEVFENAAHFAREGHSAHAEADGDRHEPSDTEHGCTGAMHLCSCCVSLSYLPAHATSQGPEWGLRSLGSHPPSVAIAGAPHGVYHPPRT